MRTRLIAAVAAAVLLAACGGDDREEAAGDRVLVVASTSIHASLVRAVGGDAVEVTALTSDAAADPHELSLSAAQAATLERAALVVVNGGGYDDAVAAAARPREGRRVIDAVAVAGVGAPGDESFNEHVWYSVQGVRRLVAELGTTLATLAPGSSKDIEDAAAGLDQRLGALEERVTAVRNRTTGSGPQAAVTEPVADLLLRDLGLRIATPSGFTEAVEEGTDPAAADLKAQLDLLRSRSVRLLVENAQTTSAVTDQVAAEAERAGIPVVRAHEQLPADVPDLVALLEEQVAELDELLARPATP